MKWKPQDFINSSFVEDNFVCLKAWSICAMYKNNSEQAAQASHGEERSHCADLNPMPTIPRLFTAPQCYREWRQLIGHNHFSNAFPSKISIKFNTTWFFWLPVYPCLQFMLIYFSCNLLSPPTCPALCRTRSHTLYDSISATNVPHGFPSPHFVDE